MKNRITGVVLLALILFQSCTVYQKTSAPLKSPEYYGKVKIVNNAGQEFYFDDIIFIDSIYYGVLGEDTVIISQNSAPEIYLLDYNKTLRNKNVIRGIGVFMIALAIIAGTTIVVCLAWSNTPMGGG